MYVSTCRELDNSFQFTRSWRTGGRFRNHLRHETAANPPIRGKGESLGSYLKRRNLFYKTISDNVQTAPRYGNKVLTSDNGHSFHTVTLTHGSGLRVYDRTGSKPSHREDIVVPELLLLNADYQLIRSMTEPSGFFSVHTDSSVTLSHGNQLNKAVLGSYNNMIPDASEYGWGETVVELLMGNFPKAIPDIIKRAKRGRDLSLKGTKDGIKDAAGDYLNARFGIEPIVKDVIKVIENLSSVHENLYDNYKRERHSMAPISVVTPVRRLVSNTGDNTAFSVPTSRWTETQISTDYRHVAKFTKARPSAQAQSFYDEAQAVLRRLGYSERLTWDLIPWSWLVDWSGNIGNSIENAAAYNAYSGRFATVYSWVTRYTSYYAQVEAYTSKNSYSTETVPRTFRSALAKERYQVSPFGPSFTMPSLSAYQWSILTSLGLAKIK